MASDVAEKVSRGCVILNYVYNINGFFFFLSLEQWDALKKHGVMELQMRFANLLQKQSDSFFFFSEGNLFGF